MGTVAVYAREYEWDIEPLPACDVRTDNEPPPSWLDGPDDIVVIDEPRERQSARAKELRSEIKAASRILELEHDWDGEGSEPYSKDTLDRAVDFLKRHVNGLWESYGIECPVPRIGPALNGSVDIHWKQPKWELLVNIPAGDRSVASFYGDNYGIQTIKGSLDPDKFNLGIAEWLKS
jgi:hypothetical protein